jgi:hypothetical protein
MANAITRLLQHRSLRRAVHHALDSGVGLYRASWSIAPGASDAVAGELIAWCRQVLGSMHRPYGVDSVSLAIAAVAGAGLPLASANFAVLRPSDFYAGPIEAETRETLRRWTEEGIFLRSPAVRLSVVFFSWGDLTQELLLAG